MTANDSQDFAHEFTPTNRFGRTRPNLSTTLPRFSKTRAGSCPLGQCTVTSRHRLPPPRGPSPAPMLARPIVLGSMWGGGEARGALDAMNTGHPGDRVHQPKWNRVN